MPSSSEAERAQSRSTAPDRIAVFGVLWAVASVFHLLAVGEQGPAWAQVLLAVSAGLAVFRPGAVGPLALLASAGLLTAWYEAPDGPESWLLAAVVNVGILLCASVGLVRGRPADRVDLAERLFPPARVCLLAVVAFTGFARINSGYLDRRVSCGVLRFHETTSSIGLDALQLDGAAWLERAVILGSIAVPLAVALFLLLARTRPVGLVLALVVVAVLGLNRDESLWAASAVGLALLSTFLPAVGPWAAERIGSVRARLALRGPRLPLMVRGGLAVGTGGLGLAAATGALDGATADDVGWWVWQVGLLFVIASVARLLRQAPGAVRVKFLPDHPAFAVIPLLIVLNGVAPYLELKTAGTWTAWSNLRTVGESNHLIAGTASLGGSDTDVVRIVDTDDPTLARYRSRAVGITWRELTAYLSEHPEVAITYVREGRRVSVAAAEERSELVGSVPAWQRKLFPLLPVDLVEPERCLNDPGPGHS